MATVDDVIKEARREEEQFRKLLPDKGFIADYMRYSDGHESPGSYHFWVATTLIAGVIQRRAWINRGVYDIFPNLYVVLVSPSGRCRKSSAMRYGLANLVQDFEWMNVIADKTTPEALLEALQFGTSNLEKDNDDPSKINFNVDNAGFLKATELSVFINKQTYMSGMVPLLTDLYDCPKSFKYVTRNKRPIYLNNVALNFLGASTPEWLASSLPEDAFEGGFMSRIIFVVRHHKDRIITWSHPPDPQLVDSLKKQLIEIRKYFRDHVPLSREAYQWFDHWYRDLSATPLDDVQMSGFVERKPDTVLKLGLLLSAAEDPKDKLVRERHLKQAHKILSWTQERMFRAFENIDLSHFGQLRKKVQDLLKQNGEIKKRDLYRKLGGKVKGLKQLEEVATMMREAGELEIHTHQPKGGGRPSIVYKSTA